MTLIAFRARRWQATLGLLMLFAACSRGCAESQFELAPESRVPKWFTLPGGMQRTDVGVTLIYYIGSAGRTATVTLHTRQGKELQQVVATQRGKEPLTLEPHGDTGRIPYPSYEVLTANGITDVVEHRRMEPVFYITDDPVVKAKLGVHE